MIKVNSGSSDGLPSDQQEATTKTNANNYSIVSPGTTSNGFENRGIFFRDNAYKNGRQPFCSDSECVQILPRWFKALIHFEAPITHE